MDNIQNSKLLELNKGIKPELLDFDTMLKTVKERKEVFSQIIPYLQIPELGLYHDSCESGLTPEAREVRFIKVSSLISNYGIPVNTINDRMMQSVKYSSANSTRYNENTLISDNELIHELSLNRFVDSLMHFSTYGCLHPIFKNWIASNTEEDFSSGSAGLMKRFVIKFWEELGLEKRPDYDEAGIFRDTCYQEFVSFTNTHIMTNHPLVYKDPVSGYQWLTGKPLLYRIFDGMVKNMFLNIERTRRFKKLRKEALAKFQLSTSSAGRLDLVLKELSAVQPKNWNNFSNLTAFSKYYANKRFSPGSLVGVEIEFLGTLDTPGIGRNQCCGDCEGCQNEGDCENPPCPEIEFPQVPFVWWKHDGSVSTTSQEQVLLGYQEVNMVCNILDKKDVSRITDTLKWMKSQNMVVNKTCGLHVHMDCRHMLQSKVMRKATKLDEAMINWIQFMMPMTRITNSYCRVFCDNPRERYKAVNRTSYVKHETLEIRVGAASLNPAKVVNWVKMCHYLFNTKEDYSTITGFLKTDVSPEIKALVISRILAFYDSHVNGRNPNHKDYQEHFFHVSSETEKKRRMHIPQEIHDLVKMWKDCNTTDYPI